MNKGTYGYPLPPNAPTRVAPPEWKSCKLITTTTSTEVVPQNVFQMGVAVFGGGANGSGATAGGGGGFAFGILDVVPGQYLPTLTVGPLEELHLVGHSSLPPEVAAQVGEAE